jgi:hypothetical protein
MPDLGDGENYSAKFEGERFRPELGMPASALAEVVALDLAIRRLARLIVYSRGRKVPPGFDEQFDLRVDRFGPGSKTAEMTRFSSAPQLEGIQIGDVFDDANESLLSILEWAASDDPGPPTQILHVDNRLVVRAMRSVLPLGRTLDHHETIVFGKVGGVVGRCTRRTHQRIQEAAAPGLTVKDCLVVGDVVSHDFEALAIRVKPLATRKQISVMLDEPLPIELLEHLNQGRRTVVIRGRGFYRPDGQLQEVLEPTIAHAAARGGAAMKRSRAQFDKNVRAIEARTLGWLDGTISLAPDSAALELAVRVVREAVLTLKIPYPIVGSTPDGGVTLDWVRSPWRLGGEIEPGSSRLELFAASVEPGVEPSYRTVDLGSPVAASEIAAFVGWIQTEAM